MAQLDKANGAVRAYTRRPVPVEAIQWQVWNEREVADFVRCVPRVTKYAEGKADLQVPGLTRITEGDWIVRDQAGFLVAWTDHYFNHLYQGE